MKGDSLLDWVVLCGGFFGVLLRFFVWFFVVVVAVVVFLFELLKGSG